MNIIPSLQMRKLPQEDKKPCPEQTLSGGAGLPTWTAQAQGPFCHFDMLHHVTLFLPTENIDHLALFKNN